MLAIMSISMASAQEEVPPASELRKALFDLARPQIEAEADRAVKFKGSMKQYEEWVFFSGQIVDKNDAVIRVGPGESAETAVLWVRRKGKWFVLEAVTGFGDVIWIDWPEKHGAPKVLFGE